ncbi:ArsR family transcriptional regulator [Candidatus Woesearchaeota archaeon]|nr:ArsR family transcriptional regulator [Candidatus Woesearchaeota archaeon]
MTLTLRPQRGQCYWQKELDTAMRSLKAGKDILILGPAKIGKSSFLLNLQHELEKKQNTIPIIFSGEHVTGIEQYVDVNLHKTLNAFSSLFGEAQPIKNLSNPLMEIDSQLQNLKLDDKTKAAIKLLTIFHHDPQSDIHKVINTLFSLPELLASHFKKQSIILIDSANPLHRLKSDKTLLSEMTDFLESRSSGKGSVFAIASDFDPHIKDATTIHIKPWTLDQTQKFFKDHDVSLDGESLTIIYNFSEGYPLYLNLISRWLRSTGPISATAIKHIIEDLLDNELHLYFSERLNSLSPKELPILFCMAEHDVNSPSRISRILNYSQTNVRRFLSIMEEKGFVSNPERGTFIIHDNVFKIWLRREK